MSTQAIDLEKRLERFSTANALAQYSYQDIFSTISQAYQLMANAGHPLYDRLRRLGLSYFLQFIHSGNLEKIVRNSLGEDALKFGFRKLEAKKWCYFNPRGVVFHWLAGNVPILGLLSLTLAIVTKNKSVIKLPSESEDYITPFVQTFASDQIRGKSREIAQSIIDSSLVLRFGSHEKEIALLVSKYADVRIVWGSQEAVDAVQALPAQKPLELISFGPKVSAAVVDLAELSQKDVLSLVRDIVLFQQLACTSPHVILIKGAIKEARALGHRIVECLDSLTSKRPDLFDYGASSSLAILENRMELAINNYPLVKSKNNEWTIYFGAPLPGRFGFGYGTIGICPVSSMDRIARYLPNNIQTLCQRVNKPDLERLKKVSVEKKVDRLVDLGASHAFELPWDGLNVIDKLTHKLVVWNGA